MKNHMKKLFTLIAITLFVYNVFAQAPQRLSYQAVIRNSTGGLVTNHAVGMKISILQESATGTPVYVETHTSTTNANGLATIEIGGGNVVSGTFATINWSGVSYYLKTETDPAGGTNYNITGTSQLLSVPYALFADKGNGLILPYKGTIASSSDPGFTITNSLGGGLKAESTVSTGNKSGIVGSSSSSEGYGVTGSSPFIGVYGVGHYGISGYSNSGETNGIAIYGLHNAVSNVGYGVYANSMSSAGFGVYGLAQSSSGDTRGVYGETRSASGHAIHGYTTNSNGFSGYFTGGKVYINGRTGIRTSSPEAGLHISGTAFPESFLYLQSNSGQDAGIRFYEGTTPKWSLFCEGSTDGLQIYNYGGVTAIFCKQVSPCYVGIGTSQPTCQLQVGTLGDGSQARANAWNLLSDIRLKKDFSDLSDPLSMISKLKGFYFYWNTGTDQTRQVGFSAQDVRKVLPEVVSSASDGYLAIEYGKMAPLFVEAIKALKAENEELKARLERLEAKVGK